MTMTMIFSDKSRKRLRFGICSTEVTRKMAQNLRPAQHTNTKPNLLTVAPLSVHQQQPPLLSTIDLTSPQGTAIRKILAPLLVQRYG